MVGIDATFLGLMLHPKARPPLDPNTKKPIERLPDRIEKLIEDLDDEGERIILPTPVLSEFLIIAGKDGSDYLAKISALKTILVRPFDELAAVELAAIENADRAAGDKRGGVSSPWTKVKFDRQIVAVCKVNGTTKIYSDDGDVRKFAKKVGIDTIATWELPLPTAKQEKLFETGAGK
jgi:predicted nucleic acid-binding protein